MAKKFTFKTDKPTGKWKSFNETFHYIKLNQVVIGTISEYANHTISLRIIKNDINEDGNTNCEWKWITLICNHNSLQEAKNWLNERFTAINEKYKFPTD